MKFYFNSAFSLLFYGLYRIYAPFCYPYLSRTDFQKNLIVIRFYYFTFRSLDAKKVNIYKKTYLASSIIVFTPLIFSPCINVSNCFILLRRTATKAQCSFTSTCPTSSRASPPFLYKKPTISTLFSLSFFPLPIYKVAHRDLAGFGSTSGNSKTSISSGMYSGTRSSLCRMRQEFPSASQRAVRPLRCVQASSLTGR